jgi:prepilin-type N-terminal cleavage/methylation domain-containing protein
MIRLHVPQKQQGFTLIELMVSTAIFVLLAGAIFALLAPAQMQFQNQSQIVGAFEEARLGMDQIVRDVNVAGYPAISNFSQAPANASQYAITPIAWNPGYPAAPPCFIGTAGGGTCVTPGDFDLIVEGNVDSLPPPAAPIVKWIRYQLVGTTLMRGVVDKTPGADPASATAPAMLPYVLNVMNNAVGVPGVQIAQIKALPTYASMFPGGNPVPVFQYTCDTASGAAASCTNLPACPPLAANGNCPQSIRDVSITLIVMTPQPDAQTGQLRLVELNGRAHRINPLQ